MDRLQRVPGPAGHLHSDASYLQLPGAEDLHEVDQDARHPVPQLREHGGGTQAAGDGAQQEHQSTTVDLGTDT